MSAQRSPFGTVFQTDEDIAIQREVAGSLSRDWGVPLFHYGDKFSPIDCYAERRGRVLGFVEIKARKNPRQQYPTVYLAVRKLMALHCAARHRLIPVFAAAFSDGEIGWIDVNGLRNMDVVMAGRPARYGSSNDREPCVEVPISSLCWAGMAGSPFA